MSQVIGSDFNKSHLNQPHDNGNDAQMPTLQWPWTGRGWSPRTPAPAPARMAGSASARASPLTRGIKVGTEGTKYLPNVILLSSYSTPA